MKYMLLKRIHVTPFLHRWVILMCNWLLRLNWINIYNMPWVSSVHFVDRAQMEVFPIVYYGQGVLADSINHTFIHIMKLFFESYLHFKWIE